MVSGWIAVHELCEYYFLVYFLPQWKIVSPVDFPVYSSQATYTQPYNGRDGKMRIEINHYQHHHKYHPKQNMSIQLYALARFACLQYEFPMLLDQVAAIVIAYSYQHFIPFPCMLERLLLTHKYTHIRACILLVVVTLAIVYVLFPSVYNAEFSVPSVDICNSSRLVSIISQPVAQLTISPK